MLNFDKLMSNKKSLQIAGFFIYRKNNVFH